MFNISLLVLINKLWKYNCGNNLLLRRCMNHIFQFPPKNLKSGSLKMALALKRAQLLSIKLGPWLYILVIHTFELTMLIKRNQLKNSTIKLIPSS